jgi:hypothetical protein
MTTELIWNAFADELEKVAAVGFLAVPSKLRMLMAGLGGSALGLGGVSALGEAARQEYPEQFAEDSWRGRSDEGGVSPFSVIRGAVGGGVVGGAAAGPAGAMMGIPAGAAAGAGTSLGMDRAQPLLSPETGHNWPMLLNRWVR